MDKDGARQSASSESSGFSAGGDITINNSTPPPPRPDSPLTKAASVAAIAAAVLAALTFGGYQLTRSEANGTDEEIGESESSPLLTDQPNDESEQSPTTLQPGGPSATDTTEPVVDDDVERVTALESSLLIGHESNNLNWSVGDLTPDVAAYGVDGEATSVQGVAFQLGGYSAQTQPPVIEAEFNLGRDYSVLRALVGLTDNSEEDDPVQVEIVDAVDGESLFSGTVAVGSPQVLELPVDDVLRIRVTITGGTQFSSSWLTFSQLS